MDINIVRAAVTVVSFLTFLGILFYAAHPGNRQRFEEQGRSVLEDERE